jgi:hypothetical protein
MTEWGTRIPDLTLIRNACRVLEDDGLDVHTITVMLNNGYWAIRIESTDEDMRDVARDFILDAAGRSIEPAQPI